MKWLPFVALLAVGCGPRLLVTPWPCDRYRERPAVQRELVEMRITTKAVLTVGNTTTVYEPGNEGLYRATREWALEMDAKCAGDRALVGEAVRRPLPGQELSWWERGWVGRLLRWPRETFVRDGG